MQIIKPRSHLEAQPVHSAREILRQDSEFKASLKDLVRPGIKTQSKKRLWG